MRCIGICCVRNEADIIELSVRYNLHLLDELHIIDNLSEDRTLWVLKKLQDEGLPLHIHTSDDPSHQQEAITSRLARKIVALSNVDFVVPLDADELLSIQSREEFHSILNVIPPGSAGAMLWQTFLPDTDSNNVQPFFRRMTKFRKFENWSLSKLILPADMCCQYSWSPGSHQALHIKTGETIPRVNLPFRLAHFPIRDANQLACKILVGAHALSLKKNRHTGEGSHWFQLAQKLHETNYNIDALNLHEIALSYSLDPETMPVQQILQCAVPDFPEIKQIYPVESLSIIKLIDRYKSTL